MGWSMGDSLKLFDVESSSPLWAAPFPRQKVLICLGKEIELSTSMHICSLLLLTVSMKGLAV